MIRNGWHPLGPSKSKDMSTTFFLDVPFCPSFSRPYKFRCTKNYLLPIVVCSSTHPTIIAQQAPSAFFNRTNNTTFAKHSNIFYWRK